MGRVDPGGIAAIRRGLRSGATIPPGSRGEDGDPGGVTAGPGRLLVVRLWHSFRVGGEGLTRWWSGVSLDGLQNR